MRIVLCFLVYGLLVGLWSISWHQGGRELPLLLNVPGELLGEILYLKLHDPYAPNPPLTVPWLLRLPYVYVTASVAFWGLVGTLVWLTVRGVRWSMVAHPGLWRPIGPPQKGPER